MATGRFWFVIGRSACNFIGLNDHVACSNNVDEADEDEEAWTLTFRYVGTSVLLQSTHRLIGGGLATIEGAVIVKS